MLTTAVAMQFRMTSYDDRTPHDMSIYTYNKMQSQSNIALVPAVVSQYYRTLVILEAECTWCRLHEQARARAAVASPPGSPRRRVFAAGASLPRRLHERLFWSIRTSGRYCKRMMHTVLCIAQRLRRQTKGGGLAALPPELWIYISGFIQRQDMVVTDQNTVLDIALHIQALDGTKSRFSSPNPPSSRSTSRLASPAPPRQTLEAGAAPERPTAAAYSSLGGGGGASSGHL